MTLTQADLEAGRALVRAALVPYGRKPSDRDLTDMTRRLLELGAILIPQAAALRPKSATALADWERLISEGESGGPLGTWTYARALARTLRVMLGLLTEEAGR